jgi:hypothetical protein
MNEKTQVTALTVYFEPNRYIARTAATISGEGCGHGRGTTDITGSSLRPHRGKGDKGKEAAA